MSRKNKILWLIPLLAAVDLASKYLIVRHKSFSDTVVQNPGLPFGLNLPSFLNSALIFAALIIFCFVFLRSEFSREGLLGFALIVGGASANLLDRLVDGRVVDFLNIGVSTLNFADIFIFAGILYLLVKWTAFKHA